jgi:mannose-6-phosphate isomerase-like protein (cupin superfamily)
MYFCIEGGGMMHTAEESVPVRPGSLVVHPKGELHEYENGAERTLLFRVRYGGDPTSRIKEWRGNAAWEPNEADREYFEAQAVS